MTFEELKNKVESYKLEIAKYSGMIQSTKEAWKAQYGTDDISQIKAILESKQNELKQLQEAIANATAEAEALINDIESNRK